MFIDSERSLLSQVELDSLASSLKNDVLSDQRDLKYSKTGSGLSSVFSRHLPKFCQVECVGN